MDREEAEGDNFTYWGHRLLAGAQYTLPWQNIRLKYDVDVHLRRYDDRNSILPTLRPDTVRRKDEEITNIVRVEWPLPASLTLAGEYQNIRKISRLPPAPPPLPPPPNLFLVVGPRPQGAGAGPPGPAPRPPLLPADGQLARG